jgi:hypothetical protein
VTGLHSKERLNSCNVKISEGESQIFKPVTHSNDRVLEIRKFEKNIVKSLRVHQVYYFRHVKYLDDLYYNNSNTLWYRILIYIKFIYYI